MSKYFNQIAGTRAEAFRHQMVELPKFPTLIEKADVFPGQADAMSVPAKAQKDAGKSGLEACRRIRIVESALLQNRFRRSDSLDEAEESYRVLRTRLLRLKASQGLRSVQLASATAGEGKTMTALNLAVRCANLQDMSVLLVDADIRSKGLTGLLELPPSPGLAEVLCGRTEPEKAILATDATNLYVLPSGASDVAPPELFAGPRWQEFMSWCNKTFKLIIVDSPPMLGLSDSELISAPCDGVLMVIRERQVKRELLEKLARQLDAKKLLGLVYNAAEHSKTRSGYYGAPEAALKLG